MRAEHSLFHMKIPTVVQQALMTSSWIYQARLTITIGECNRVGAILIVRLLRKQSMAILGAIERGTRWNKE